MKIFKIIINKFFIIELFLISSILPYSDIFDREWFENARCRQPDALCEKCFSTYHSYDNPKQDVNSQNSNSSSTDDELFIDSDNEVFNNNQASEAPHDNESLNFTDGEDMCTDKRVFMSKATRIELREQTREMFSFAYDNYLRFFVLILLLRYQGNILCNNLLLSFFFQILCSHAFPSDELDPIHCRGRGPDVNNPYAFGIYS